MFFSKINMIIANGFSKGNALRSMFVRGYCCHAVRTCIPYCVRRNNDFTFSVKGFGYRFCIQFFTCCCLSSRINFVNYGSGHDLKMFNYFIEGRISDSQMICRRGYIPSMEMLNVVQKFLSAFSVNRMIIVNFFNSWSVPVGRFTFGAIFTVLCFGVWIPFMITSKTIIHIFTSFCNVSKYNIYTVFVNIILCAKNTTMLSIISA